MIDQLAQKICEAQHIVVFTGAGMSTESGISDYRSKGGLWQKFKPVTIQEFLASKEKRYEYWTTKLELYKSLEGATPNKGHYAIAKLFEIGKLRGLITQNIDGLHALSGVPQNYILEIHGNNRETICLDCGDITDWTDTYQILLSDNLSPTCNRCRGLLKPNTISFGQELDSKKLDSAMRLSSETELFIAIGSSLVVEPAASLPRLAKQNHADLVIINNSETPLDQHADLLINMPAGEVLEKVLNKVDL